LPLPPAVIQLAQAMAKGLARAGPRGREEAAPQPDDRPPLVDLREAARLLDVPRMTVTRLCDQGRLPCVVVAQGARQKLRRVPRAFIDAVAAEALVAGGEVDLAGFASASLARHTGAGRSRAGRVRRVGGCRGWSGVSETVTLSTLGPHSPEYTVTVADALAECVRVLNHATRSDDAIGYPGAVYQVLGALYTATGRLPQLLSQLSGWLERETEAGRLAEHQHRLD